MSVVVGTLSSAGAAATVELRGNYQTLGIEVTLASGDDPDLNARAVPWYRVSGQGELREGLPLDRVAATRFVGSLFWLTPGTSYDVEVRFADGGVLGGTRAMKSGATRREIVIPAPLRVVHAAPNGAGTACSEATPCALTEATRTARAGDEVRLASGTYFVGGLPLTASGTEGAPIVVRSAPGGRAILDGADPGAFTWTSAGGGVYRTTLRVPEPHYVLVGGQRLFPYTSLAEVQSLPDGIGGMTASGTTLSVRLPGNPDPSGMSPVISREHHAFDLSGQRFVYFVELTFRHYGQGEYAQALFLNGSSDNLVRGCTFARNDIGIGLKAASHRNTIEGSEFYDVIGEWPWQRVKDTGGIEDGGINVYDPLTGQGNVIRGSHFHDDFDAAHLCPTGGGAPLEMDFHDNRVENMVDDGLETDGQCSNVRIFGNTFSNVLMAVSLAPVQTGPIYVVRNLMFEFGAGGFAPGSAFKLNSGFGRSGPIHLYHNTANAVTADTSAFTLFTPGSWTSLTARNNIFAGTAYAIENNNTSQPLDLDYDALYTSRAGELVFWGGGGSSHLTTLAAFRSATRQEAHGLVGAPGFVNAGAGDHRLAEGSAMIDQGVVLPGINDGFGGSAPDLGAFELGAPALGDGGIGPTADGGSDGDGGGGGGSGDSGYGCRAGGAEGGEAAFGLCAVGLLVMFGIRRARRGQATSRANSWAVRGGRSRNRPDAQSSSPSRR